MTGEKSATPGKAPSRVDVQTARFFAAQRPPREDQEGERLSVKFGNIPEAPPRKDTPTRQAWRASPLSGRDTGRLGQDRRIRFRLGGCPYRRREDGYLVQLYRSCKRAKGKTVAFIAGTDELLSQARGKIRDATGQTPGLVQGSEKDFSRPVTVISHGTVASNPYGVLPKGYKPDVLIIDEAHHAGAEGYRNLIAAMSAGEKGGGKLVGFTATPYRNDGQPLDKIFGNTVCRVDTGDLIKDGYLLPPTVVDADLTGPGGRKAEINDASNLPELYADGIAKARAEGRRKIIVFVAGGPDGRPTDVVQRTTDELKSRGISAGEVMGSTSEAERKRAVARFNRAREGVLINYGTLNEGFDAPSTDAIILGRNTESVGTLAQIVGRGMRPDPDNPKKSDVLVLNYSSRPAAEIERLVYNQAGGDGKGITCGGGESVSKGRIRFKNPPPTPRKSLSRSTSQRAPRRRESSGPSLNLFVSHSDGELMAAVIRFRQPGDVDGGPSMEERRRQRQAQAEQEMLERLTAEGPPVAARVGRPPRTVHPKVARMALDYLEQDYSIRSVAKKFGWGKTWLEEAIKQGKLQEFAESEDSAD